MAEKSSSRPGAVILDVDGVLLSFSNRRFYGQLVLETARVLKHLSPNRKNIIENIKAFKKSGAGGLFAYLHNMCRDDATFEKVCSEIAGRMDYSKIKPDPQLKKNLEQLSRTSNVIIRTDGISEIAGNVFQRLTGGDYKGKKIPISDIRDNNFQTKTNQDSWNRFAEKYGIDLSKSELVDDSKANIITAAKVTGNQGHHVSKKQPLHQILSSMTRAAAKEHQKKIEQQRVQAQKIAASTKKRLKKSLGR